MSSHKVKSELTPAQTALSRRDILKSGGALALVSLALPFARESLVRGQDADYAFDYFIGPNGSDSNPGTLQQPWAITAINTKQSVYGGLGKKIGIIAGTYNVQALAASRGSGSGGYSTWVLDVDGGTSSSGPTVIASCDSSGHYQRGAAILTQKVGSVYGNPNNNSGSGTARAGNPTIGQSPRAPHRGYVTIDGLALTGNISASVQFNQVSQGTMYGITVKNCEFFDNNGIGSEDGDNLCCLSLAVCESALVQNNYFHDCVGYSAGSLNHLSAVLQWQSNNVICEFNTAVNCGGLYGKEGPQNGNTIRHNYVDISMFSSGDTAFSALSDFVEGNSSAAINIYGNVFVGMHPLSAIPNLGGMSTSPVNIYNNTCVMSPTSGGADYYGIGTCISAAKALSIYNNIIYNDTGGRMTEGYLLLNLGSIRLMDFNLYCRGGGSDVWTSWASQQSGGVGYSTLSAWQAATGGDRNSIAATTDPLFTKTGSFAEQYKLQPSSPALGMGRIGGLLAGAVCDMGAWGAGRVGHDFGALPEPPRLTVS